MPKAIRYLQILAAILIQIGLFVLHKYNGKTGYANGDPKSVQFALDVGVSLFGGGGLLLIGSLIVYPHPLMPAQFSQPGAEPPLSQRIGFALCMVVVAAMFVGFCWVVRYHTIIPGTY